MAVNCLYFSTSVCLYRGSTAAAAAGGFAAEVGSTQAADIDAAARHAGHVNFGTTIRWSNMYSVLGYYSDSYKTLLLRIVWCVAIFINLEAEICVFCVRNRYYWHRAHDFFDITRYYSLSHIGL